MLKVATVTPAAIPQTSLSGAPAGAEIPPVFMAGQSHPIYGATPIGQGDCTLASQPVELLDRWHETASVEKTKYEKQKDGAGEHIGDDDALYNLLFDVRWNTFEAAFKTTVRTPREVYYLLRLIDRHTKSFSNGDNDETPLTVSRIKRLAEVTKLAAGNLQPDPIFAVIASFQPSKDVFDAAYDKYDEAEFATGKRIGRDRPYALVEWRDHMIGESEIELRREQLLAEGKLSADHIETEYRSTKKRYRAQIAKIKVWDQEAGSDLAELKKDSDRARTALHKVHKRLSTTAPTTPAGAAALLQLLLDDDLQTDEGFWHLDALRNVTTALAKM